MKWCTGEINLPLRLRCVRFYIFMQWINLVVCLLDYEWLSGEINLPLRLRCVRWYYAMNEPCGVFVGLWMTYGRDESVPTVCLLLYIYAMNKPCGVFVGLWMIVGRDKSAPTSTVCSLIYILRNEWALWSVRWYIYCAINKLYGMFAEYYTLQVLRYLDMFLFNDCRARWICPTPAVCSLLYIYAMNRPCGMSVDIHFK